MFRTIVYFIKLVVDLLKRNKKLKEAEKLEKQGRIKERDIMVRPIVQDWAKTLIYNTKSTVKVIGEENVPKDRSIVLIGNHQSYMDIPLLLGFVDTPLAFISKAEILKVPIISRAMIQMQCEFMERNNPRQSLQTILKAIENIKKGYSTVIFPEGTRSKGGPVIDFKPGSFKLAFKSGAPIVPITIDGTWRLYEDKKRINSGHINLTIHKPIETANLSKDEMHELPEKIREIVLSAL